MIKAFFKKRQIKLEVERYISEWDLEFSTKEDIVNRLGYDLKSAMKEELLKSIQYEIHKSAKELLFEILEDQEFKVGLKDAVRQDIKNKFMNYLEKA